MHNFRCLSLELKQSLQVHPGLLGGVGVVGGGVLGCVVGHFLFVCLACCCFQIISSELVQETCENSAYRD